MKIEGKITILVNADYTTITIEDEKANARFVTIKLTPQQLCAALSRQMSVNCELEVNGIEKIGKKHENEDFTFEIPENLASSNHAERLQKIAQNQLAGLWIAESYFGSQNSFFKIKDKQFARVTIRRWVS